MNALRTFICPLCALSYFSCYCSRSNGAGPIRSKQRGKPAPREKKVKQTPKSAEELDKELDAFMKDDTAPGPAQTEDVEMKA